LFLFFKPHKLQMAELCSLLIAFKCFALFHLCACARHEVHRSATQPTVVREPIHKDVTSAIRYKAAVEHRKTFSARKSKDDIIKEPKFEEEEDISKEPADPILARLGTDPISKLLGTSGVKMLRIDYLHVFTHRGFDAFSGPAKDEFMADCMRDVMHWIGKDTKTTPVQRMQFCEKFWKIQNTGEDFSNEIKSMEGSDLSNEIKSAQGPCSGGSTVQGTKKPCTPPDAQGPCSGGSNVQGTKKPCSTPSAPETRSSQRTFAGGGPRHEDAGGRVSVDQLNRAVPLEGHAEEHGERDVSVSAVSDSDTTSHWSRGDAERDSYPEANGRVKPQGVGADAKSPFRPTGWHSGTQRLKQSVAVFVLLFAGLPF